MNVESVIEELKKLEAKKVFVQFGEGIKPKVQEIAEHLKKKGFFPIICCEETFGGCDVREDDALRLGCDAILQIGHSKFVETKKIPVVYWEYFIDVEESRVREILSMEFSKLSGFERVGLVSTLQFVKLIEHVKEFLEEKGKKVFVRRGLRYDGEITGCNLSAAKSVESLVDCFLCISAGKFHPLGLALSTHKPTFWLDLERGRITSMENDRLSVMKIKAWNLSKLEEAKKVGILISWKLGQMRKGVEELVKRLEKAGKEVYMCAMDEVSPEKLVGLKLDALVSLACPRLAIDDLARFEIPLVDAEDAMRMLKKL